MDEQALLIDVPTPRLSAERTDKNAHLLISPWMGFGCRVSQLLPEVLASDWPVHGN